MLIGTVIGNVWATKKDPTLTGLRFLVIRPFTTNGDESAESIVAVDPLGAGIGERVLVVFGRAARHCIGRSHDIGFQTAVSAIIDKLELEDGRVIGSTSEHDEPARTDTARTDTSGTPPPDLAPVSRATEPTPPKRDYGALRVRLDTPSR